MMKKNNESKTSKVIKAAGIAGAAIGGATLPANMVMAQEVEEKQIEELLENELETGMESSVQEPVALASLDLEEGIDHLRELDWSGPGDLADEEFTLENASAEPVSDIIGEEIASEVVDEVATPDSPYAEYDRLLNELKNATGENQAAAEQAVAEAIINLNVDKENTEILGIEKNEDETLSVTYKNGEGTEFTQKYRYENVGGEIKVVAFNQKLTVDAGIVTDYILPGVPAPEKPMPNLNGTNAPQLSFDYAGGKGVITLDGKTYENPTQEGDYLVFTIQSNSIKTTTVRVLKDGTEAEINEYGSNGTNLHIRVNSGLVDDINDVKPELNNKNLIRTTKIAGKDVVHFGDIDPLTGSKVIIRDSVGNYRRLVDKETGAEIKVVSGLLWNINNVSFLDGNQAVVGAHRIGVDEFGEYHLYDNNGVAVKDLKVDTKTFIMFEMQRESILYSEMGIDEGELNGHQGGYKDWQDSQVPGEIEGGEEQPGGGEEQPGGGEEQPGGGEEQPGGGEEQPGGGEEQPGGDNNGDNNAPVVEDPAAPNAPTVTDTTPEAATDAAPNAPAETDAAPATTVDTNANTEAAAPAADTADVAPAADTANATAVATDTTDAANATAAATTATAPAATTTATATTVVPAAEADAQVPLAQVNLEDVEAPLGNLQVGDVVELDDIDTPQSAIALGTAVWWSAIPLVGAAASIGEKIKNNKKQKAEDNGDIIEGLDDDIK